jgi:hypothetical protein
MNNEYFFLALAHTSGYHLKMWAGNENLRVGPPRNHRSNWYRSGEVSKHTTIELLGSFLQQLFPPYPDTSSTIVSKKDEMASQLLKLAKKRFSSYVQLLHVIIIPPCYNNSFILGSQVECTTFSTRSYHLARRAGAPLHASLLNTWKHRLEINTRDDQQSQIAVKSQPRDQIPCRGVNAWK